MVPLPPEVYYLFGFFSLNVVWVLMQLQAEMPFSPTSEAAAGVLHHMLPLLAQGTARDMTRGLAVPGL